MRNTITVFLIIMVSLIIAASCTEPNSPEDMTYNRVNFPLEIGNTWLYEVEYSSEDTNYNYQYRQTVIGKKDSIGYQWSVIKTEYSNNIKTWLTYRMADDTAVYGIVQSWFDAKRQIQFVVPSTDSTAYRMLCGDFSRKQTIKKLDSLVITPAGVFNNCWIGELKSISGKENTILKPGIGYVEFRLITYDYSNIKIIRKKITKLIEYNIK